MNDFSLVADHYARDNLLSTIRVGVEKLGKTPETITIEDLAPLDEFHIGGRLATRSCLDQLSIAADDNVLDVGCGIGGASRFAAHTYGCQVTGVDLTQEYVAMGNTLCSWVGLSHRVNLIQGSVLGLNLSGSTFDKAFMLHVGMNIADKASLAKEIWRVLKPGGVFGIYDVMQIGDEQLVFPVPWAAGDEASFVASPDEYKRALTANGFKIVNERNRHEFALEFFGRLKQESAGADGPPPLGLHILMGTGASTKYQNMIENISKGRVAPVELIACKA